MASSKEYLEFILGQLSELEEICQQLRMNYPMREQKRCCW